MSQRVLIDANAALRPQITGTGIYTAELINHLSFIGTNECQWGYYYNRKWRSQVHFLASRVTANRMKEAFDHGLAYYWDFDNSIGKWISRWVDAQSWVFLSSGKWRVFHGTSFTLPLLPRRVNGIVTVHDLGFLRFPHTEPSYIRQRLSSRLAQALRRAEGIIAVSWKTATDLQEYYTVDPKKIHVIYEGVDQQEVRWIDPADKSMLRQRWNLPERFLLFVGTLNIRKNVINLIKAFLSLNDPDLGLVLVGTPGNQYTEIEAYLQQCPEREKIRLFGYLKHEDLEVFYQLATAFVFPSLWEGFGLPVLEAMKRRLPVVTSDNSSLRELFHDSAILVNPQDPADIARGVQVVLHDDDTRAALIEKGERKTRTFTWRRMAEQTLELYRSLM